MCLESITNANMDKTTMVQCGWKSFGGTTSVPEFASYFFASGRAVPLDRWITAEGKGPGQYGAGFHIYSDEKELMPSPHRVYYRRVYYRRPHTKGKQDCRTVVVASEMYVPSDPDGWPPRT